MNQQEIDWTLWGLPHKDHGIASFEKNPEKGSWNASWALIQKTYKDVEWAVKTENKSLIRKLKERIEKLLQNNDHNLVNTFLERLKNCSMDDEAQAELMTPKQWMGKKAQTAVSHMIRSSDKEGGMHKLERFPLFYLLQDPNTGQGVNLVHLYKLAKTNGNNNEAVRMIWDELKNSITHDVGEFAADCLRDRRTKDISVNGKYAKEELIKLKKIMLTSVEQGIRHLGVEYTAKEKDHLLMKYDEGEIHMHVYEGYPEFNREDYIFSPETKQIADCIYQQHEESRSGLFVSLLWQSEESGESGEHYLYLSEYHHGKLHATLGGGWKEDFYASLKGQIDTPVFETTELAINKMKIQSGKYQMDYPISVDELFNDIIRETIKNHTEDQRQTLLNECFAVVNTGYTWEQLLKIVSVQYYLGDNALFIVLAYDTIHPLISGFLGFERKPNKHIYLQVFVLRYPVLMPLNMERTMINIRYKYFIRHSPKRDKWREWLKGRWHIQVSEPYNPDQFQRHPIPEALDPLSYVRERDSVNERTIWSMRYLEVLPPQASWDSMSRRNRRMRRSYYVNDIEGDPNIVYVLDGLSTATWDRVQLFRINAEVTVSRRGHELHNESFFLFRTREFLTVRRSGHPFREYLKKYPELQPVWSQTWKEEWPQMSEWRQFNISEPRPENQAPPANQGISTGRECIHPPVLHPARVARQRKQNQNYLMHMMYDYFTPQ